MCHIRRLHAKSFAALLLMLAASAPGWSQGTTARILGAVTDSSGAVVPKANVVATHVATGIGYPAVSDDAGRYSLPLLPIGAYSLKASLKGFKTLTREGIILEVDQTAEINLALDIGEVSQSVVVTASAPAMSTETSDVSSVVGNQQIEEMPLNGRLNIVSLLALAPGIQDFEDQSAVPTTGINPQTGGGGTHLASFTLDGVSNTENNVVRGLGDWPSLEAIQEFRVISSNASAQFGQGGAQVIVVSKSGTNSLHGSLLWYNRNRFAAAQNAIVKLAEKPAFNRNEFGGSVGGPVRLPAYKGKDRTFFFFAYEGFRLRSPVDVQEDLATAAMREGNFNGVTTIKDPVTGVAYPNNQIPLSRIDPIAAKIQSFYPMPNVAGPGVGGTGLNYVTALDNAQNVDRYSIKIDHRFSPSDSLSARFLSVNLGPNPDTTANAIFTVPGVTPVQGQFGEHERGTVLTETHIITPTWINEFTAQYRYLPVFRIPRYNNFDPSTVLPGLSTPAFGGLPDIAISGFFTMTDTLPGSQDKDYETEFIDNVTVTRGAHSVKFGYEAQWVDHFNLFNPNSTVSENNTNLTPTRGNLTFTNTYSGTKTGNAYANFLLGFPTYTADPGVGPPTQWRSWRQYAFVQDDWRVRSNLTLNIGLRLEHQPVYSNKFTNVSDFDPAIGKIIVFGNQFPSQTVSSILNNLPIVLAKNVGLPDNLSDYINYAGNMWGPRFGFAYTPWRRFVIRGGYGIFYGIWPQTDYKDTATLGSDPPFQAISTFANTTPIPTITLENPFPGAGTTPQNPTIGALAQNLRNPYTEQYNMSFEYDLQGTAIRASYVGNEGKHEIGTYNLNAVPAAPLAVQPRVPYQPFSTINWVSNPFSSNLNQLQLAVNRAYHNGMSVQVNYQYTRALGIETYDDAFYGRLSYGNLSGIRRYGLVASYVYELPFGAGRRWLNQKSVARDIAGGWEITGIPTIFSGAPYQLSFDEGVAGCPGGRPNIIGNPIPANQSSNLWFNPKAFAAPTGCTYGDEAYNSLFGPHLVNWNAGVYRNIHVTEHTNLQIRAEAFNILNHPQWGTPRTDISSSNPGQITSTSGERQVQFAVKMMF